MGSRSNARVPERVGEAIRGCRCSRQRRLDYVVVAGSRGCRSLTRIDYRFLIDLFCFLLQVSTRQWCTRSGGAWLRAVYTRVNHSRRFPSTSRRVASLRAASPRSRRAATRISKRKRRVSADTVPNLETSRLQRRRRRTFASRRSASRSFLLLD